MSDLMNILLDQEASVRDQSSILQPTTSQPSICQTCKMCSTPICTLTKHMKVRTKKKSKYYIGIDPGKVNIGIVVCRAYANILEVLEAFRTPYKSDVKFSSVLDNIVRKIIESDLSTESSEICFVIERQPKPNSISSNMRFIQGYVIGSGHKAIMKTAITHGMQIPNYSDRKKYSLELAIARIPLIMNNTLLENALKEDIRKHDIADSFNLVYEEWCREYTIAS